jgi:hypothetical protein
VVLLRMEFCCKVTPCCWVGGSCSFKGPYSFHFQSQAVQVESPCTMTQCHIQDDWNFQLFNFQACVYALGSKQFRKKFLLESFTLASEDFTVLQNVGNNSQNNIYRCLMQCSGGQYLHKTYHLWVCSIILKPTLYFFLQSGHLNWYM